MSVGWTAVEDAIHAWVVAGSGLSAERVLWDNYSGPRPTHFIEMSIRDLGDRGTDWRTYEANPLELPDVSATVEADDDVFTAAGHGFSTGDGPLDVAGSPIPAGLSGVQDYFAIRLSSSTFRLAISLANAMSGTAVNVTADGAVTVSTNDDSERVGEELAVSTHGMRRGTLVLQAFADVESPQRAVPMLTRVVASLPLHEYDLDEAGVGIGEIGDVTLVAGERGSILEPRARCEVAIHLASNLEGATEHRIASVEIAVSADGNEIGDLEIP